MGSGHFVVAMFERLVALLVAEEDLSPSQAVAQVIRNNLFGLEIDPRCAQIGAFNLALAAWRKVGHCTLPAMNLACSGLAPNVKKVDWSILAGENDRLKSGMEQLHAMFQDAPILGSLIDPCASGGDLWSAEFRELQPLLEKAWAKEATDYTAHEASVTAHGLAKAAEILSGHFTLVATNFPFLGLGKMVPKLATHIKEGFYQGRQDLSSAFLLRAINLIGRNGSIASVSPSEWTFSPTYREIRRHLLKNAGIRFLATLGNDAFTSKIRANPLLGIYDAGTTGEVPMLDAAESNRDSKSAELCSQEILSTMASRWLDDPDCKLVRQTENTRECLTRLQDFADARSGLYAGDIECFERLFWEVDTTRDVWEFLQGSVSENINFGGRSSIVLWEREQGRMFRLTESVKHLNHAAQNWRRGKPLWGSYGAAVSLMGDLSVTIYSGERYSKNCCAIVPKRVEHLEAVVAYCMDKLGEDVRAFDRSLKVDSPQTLLNLPFDLGHWQKVAAEKYPDGLPVPFSNDPTQWLFNGHPAGSDHPLQVAVARLLGYKWPRQTGTSFPDCPALGQDGLEKLTDSDGIVCLPPVGQESAASERLLNILVASYGTAWGGDTLATLLKNCDHGDKSLDSWLRDKFFSQHCKLFRNRPFIWQIWDGLSDGFSVLLNYHKLNYKTFETLIYTYLGDWIGRQKRDAENGVDGAQEKLAAAETLKKRLESVLVGEAPYDIFIRWTPIEGQPIGWNPDLVDGVRMNIRPFLSVPDVGKRGAGVFRDKPNIKWDKDRGSDMPSTPWYDLGTQYGGKVGDRINDHHLTIAEKRAARAKQGKA
jgi:hypothetical protein